MVDEIPPEAVYIESYINNPRNPLVWVSQKATQAAKQATHQAAVNLDKPAQLLKDAADAMPWYVKPGAIVGLLVAVAIIPPLAGHLFKASLSKRKSRNA